MGATKKIPQEMLDRVARLVREAVETKIPKPKRPRGGATKSPQTTIARHIKIAQPVYSDVINAKGKLGVVTLLRLREFLEMPIDDILGLRPFSAAKDSAKDPRITTIVTAVVEALAKQPAETSDGDPPVEPASREALQPPTRKQ